MSLTSHQSHRMTKDEWPLRAYAIHDTDGGRVPAFPLLRHIYSTESSAISARMYCGFDPQFYPVLPVDIVSMQRERSHG